jgi:hypothetical protein
MTHPYDFTYYLNAVFSATINSGHYFDVIKKGAQQTYGNKARRQ